jgi:hypothetical protein
MASGGHTQAGNHILLARVITSACETGTENTGPTHRTVVVRGRHWLDIPGDTRRRKLSDDKTVRSCNFDDDGFTCCLPLRHEPNNIRRLKLMSVPLEPCSRVMPDTTWCWRWVVSRMAVVPAPRA